MNDNKLEDTVTLPKVEPETVVPDLSDSLPPAPPAEKVKEGLNPIKLIAIIIMVVSIGISVFYIFFYNKKEESNEPAEIVENTTVTEEVEENETDENVTEENETVEDNETLAE